MSELKENFSKSNSSGLEHNEFLRDRIRSFSDLLKKADAKLFDHLQVLLYDTERNYI